MANIVAILLGWLNTASMTPTKGAVGKAGELVEAVEGALPARWRSRKLYVAAVVMALVVLTDVDGSRKGLAGLLGGAALFVVPEAVRDIVAAWRGVGEPSTYVNVTSTSPRV
mgnify:CR=1 FL=1